MRLVLFHLEQFGDTKIDHLHLTIAIDQDIRRLQIAVDDPLAMTVLQCCANIKKEQDPLLSSQLVDLGEFDQVSCPVEHFDREVGCFDSIAQVGTRFIDLGDVFMAQATEQLRLPPEACHGICGGKPLSKQLDGDDPFRLIL